MSYAASGGETRSELGSALHFPAEDEPLTDGLADLRRQLKRSSRRRGVDVALASSAWLDDTYADFRRDYVTSVRSAFGASLHQVEFRRGQEASATINAWVSKAAHGRIRQSVSPADFESRSRHGVIDEPAPALVNAVTFDAAWANRFDPALTRPRPFHVDGWRAVDVPMMHQRSLLLYAGDDDLAFFELPYVDNLYSMYVVLPKEPTVIGVLVRDLTAARIVELKRRALLHGVDVLLPTFELRTRLARVTPHQCGPPSWGRNPFGPHPQAWRDRSFDPRLASVRSCMHESLARTRRPRQIGS